MEARKHAMYHPSIAKFSYVIIAEEHYPSKRSFTTAQEAADYALAFATAKYGDKLINIKVLENDAVIDSLNK